jgi:hypothetical protein
MERPYFTWSLHAWGAVGIPENYQVGYYQDVEEYAVSSTYDDTDMFYAAIALQELYNEYTPQVDEYSNILTPDKIDKTNPNHYTWMPDVECKDVTNHLNFNLGCAFKYIYRNGRKEGETSIEDLKKAIMYLNFEIERLENLTDEQD